MVCLGARLKQLQALEFVAHHRIALARRALQARPVLDGDCAAQIADQAGPLQKPGFNLSRRLPGRDDARVSITALLRRMKAQLTVINHPVKNGFNLSRLFTDSLNEQIPDLF